MRERESEREREKERKREKQRNFASLLSHSPLVSAPHLLASSVLSKLKGRERERGVANARRPRKPIHPSF